VVKGAAGKTWLGVEANLRAWEKSVSPMGWFGFWGGAFLGRAGRFVALRLLLVLSIAGLVASAKDPMTHCIASGVTWVVCWFLILEDPSRFDSRRAADPARLPRTPQYRGAGSCARPW
jgi:hypothetical protein